MSIPGRLGLLSQWSMQFKTRPDILANYINRVAQPHSHPDLHRRRGAATAGHMWEVAVEGVAIMYAVAET